MVRRSRSPIRGGRGAAWTAALHAAGVAPLSSPELDHECPARPNEPGANGPRDEPPPAIPHAARAFSPPDLPRATGCRDPPDTRAVLDRMDNRSLRSSPPGLFRPGCALSREGLVQQGCLCSSTARSARDTDTSRRAVSRRPMARRMGTLMTRFTAVVIRPAVIRNAPKVTLARRWQVFLVVALANFLGWLDLTVVNIALPSIEHAFPRASLGAISWVLNAYSVVFASLLIPAGRLADVIGRRGCSFSAWPYSSSGQGCARSR